MRAWFLASVAGAAIVVGCGGQDFSATAFDQIQDGDTVDVVEESLGEPDSKMELEQTGSTVWDYCTDDFVYHVFIGEDNRVSHTGTDEYPRRSAASRPGPTRAAIGFGAEGGWS